MHLLKTALSYVAIFSVGAVTSVACFEPEFGNPSFRCSPATDDACPEDQKCCSDDPATTGGLIPSYYTMGSKYGAPIFSGNNNVLSTSGMCVETGGFQSPFANGCPVPCNPTWDAGRLLEICGDPLTAKCCQTQEMDPNKDCIMADGKWRAVTGTDIKVITSWGPMHTTNQDPNGTYCMTFATVNGVLKEDAFEDCLDQLTVANQRGFCYAPTECPCIEDVCALRNGDAPKCTAGATPPPATTATM